MRDLDLKFAPRTMTPLENMAAIRAVVTATARKSDLFGPMLRKKRIPHLSFSQITSVEFCQHQYYLQYFKLLEPKPMPTYFEKGKALHTIIAASYRRMANGKSIDVRKYDRMIDTQFSGDHNRHLKNAVRVHLATIWSDCEVVAIEQPFVMSLGGNLPPCVGVIDLILRQHGRLIIVDHKTGRGFYPQDALQMAIYHRFVTQQYGSRDCAFFYDHYRWVNNLNRIRKPAMQRTEVIIPRKYWSDARSRILKGYREIKEILTTRSTSRDGECFRCPYREQCWAD